MVVINDDDERKDESQGVAIVIDGLAFLLDFPVDLLKVLGELLFVFLDGLTFCGGAVHINHGYDEYQGKRTRYRAGHFGLWGYIWGRLFFVFWFLISGF